MKLNKNDIIKIFEEEIKEINRLDNEDCNVFRILGCGRNELKHSFFMRWLMYNDVFFEYFTKRCGINLSVDQIMEDRKILREDTYTTNEGGDLKNPLIPRDKYYNENKKFRHIDLNIIGETYSITIENKVDSGQHDDQCISYYNFMNDPECKYYNNKNGEKRKKYFVFLAKDEPKDYEYYGGLIPIKDPKGEIYYTKKEYNVEDYINEYDNNGEKKLLFFNYRLITYDNVLEILENETFIARYEREYEKKKENNRYDFVNDILEQYKGLIKEFKEMNPEYFNVFEVIASVDKDLNDIFELSDELRSKTKEEVFYQLIEKMEELSEGEDNTDFGRFLEVAQEYYLAKKKKYDEIIIPAIENIIAEDVAIKSDYGRGGYASAIPISVTNLGGDDLISLLKKLIVQQDCDESEKQNKINELLDISRKMNELIAQNNELLKDLEDLGYKKKSGISLNEIEKEYKNSGKIQEAYKKDSEKIEEYLKNKNDLDNIKLDFDEFGLKNIKANEKGAFDGNIPNSIHTVFQTVDFRPPMDGRKNITIAIVAGLNSDYSIQLCREALANDRIKKYFANEKHEYDDLNLSWSLSIKNGSGFAKDREKIEANFIKFYELFSSKTIEDKKDLFIGTIKFDEIFSENYVGFFEKLVNNEVIDKTNAKKMIECILRYFVGADNKIIEEYNKINGKSKIELQTKDNQQKRINNFFERIEKLLGEDADIQKYKGGIEKKYCLMNKKGSAWGNKQINCLWNLDILFELKKYEDYKDIDILSAEFKKCTLKGVKLFGEKYESYFNSHIFKDTKASSIITGDGSNE